MELANGCLCCTVADDFIPAIEGLLAHEKRPEHIIVETSGLALPKPLVKAFDWPEVRARLTVDGVIAVVDGAAVADGRFADDPAAVLAQREADAAVDHDNPLEEVYEDQLLCADLVVLNKSDLLSADAAGDVAEGIAALLPRAVKVVRTEEGRIDPAVLLGLSARAEDDLANRPSHHDAEPDHDHDDFDSFVVELPGDPRSRRPRGAAEVCRREPRRPPDEGFRRRRRQADAAPRPGRRHALPPALRSAVRADGGPREPAGGDRREGPRPRGRHARHPRRRGLGEPAMHVLAEQIRTLDETVQAVDLGQDPAEAVFLSFSDSDLGLVAAVHEGMGETGPGGPRVGLRLANLAALRHPYSVDLYLERVIRKARVVVVRCLGGMDYWRYGIDELAVAARTYGIALAIVPGDGAADPRLAEASTVPAEDLDLVWSWFQAGGPENVRSLMGWISTRLGRPAPYTPAVPLPACACFTEACGCGGTCLAAGKASPTGRSLSSSSIARCALRPTPLRSKRSRPRWAHAVSSPCRSPSPR